MGGFRPFTLTEGLLSCAKLFTPVTLSNAMKYRLQVWQLLPRAGHFSTGKPNADLLHIYLSFRLMCRNSEDGAWQVKASRYYKPLRYMVGGVVERAVRLIAR